MVLPARRSILPNVSVAGYVDLALDRIDIVARPGEVVAADVRQEYGEDYRRAQSGLVEVGNENIRSGGVGDGSGRDRVAHGNGVGVNAVVEGGYKAEYTGRKSETGRQGTVIGAGAWRCRVRYLPQFVASIVDDPCVAGRVK